MTDIHCHVLFDIDDGSDSLETSVQMCRDAYRNGCDAIVLTPHFFDFTTLDRFISERDRKIEILREDENIPLQLYAGAEIFLSDKIFSADSLDGLTVNGSRYILCELPLGPFDTRHVTMWIDELLDRGYVPILAHPERYYEFHHDYELIDELIDREILFQVNIDSLTGRNGEKPQGMGLDMICRGLAVLMASDAHDTTYRHTRLVEKFELFPDDITEEIVDFCMTENPEKIIKNQKI